MTNKISTKKHGFTIIEVVLVLAIAGLIFLMVFVALPALQRNQRDTQRRQDYADAGAAIISYAASNGGSFTITSGSTYGSFTPAKVINSSGKDPKGTSYSLKVCTGYASGKSTCTTNGAAAAENISVTATTAGNVYVITGTKCSNGTPSTTGATSKDFSVYGYLESGTYCNSFSM